MKNEEQGQTPASDSKKSLILKCYKNKDNLKFLASTFDVNGNRQYDCLYDIFSENTGTIKWTPTDIDDALELKKRIKSRINLLMKTTKEKIAKDKIMGHINNIPLWGSSKIDAEQFVRNPPMFRIYYR